MQREEDLASALASALLVLELVAQLRDETGATSLATPGVVLTRTSVMQKNKKQKSQSGPISSSVSEVGRVGGGAWPTCGANQQGGAN